MNAPVRDSSATAILQPGKLWSLWDIMNLVLSSIHFVIYVLQRQEQQADWKMSSPPDPPPDPPPGTAHLGLAEALGAKFGLFKPDIPKDDKEFMLSLLKYVRISCTQLELDAALDRIKRFEGKLEFIMTWADFKTETTTLREAIEDGLKSRYALYVPTTKAKLHKKRDEDWSKTIAGFPLAVGDVRSAVDCYAYGSSTACVFHLMRVAEYGLRALARERRVSLPKNRPLEWADWQALIDELHKKVKVIANKRRGPARDRALQFYQGALGEFEAFKDVYRNNVMHSRESYDEYQAISVMNHVREFMERLSSKIGENPQKQITWGIR